MLSHLVWLVYVCFVNSFPPKKHQKIPNLVGNFLRSGIPLQWEFCPPEDWVDTKARWDDGACFLMRARALALLPSSFESLSTLFSSVGTSGTQYVGVGTGTAKAA